MLSVFLITIFTVILVFLDSLFVAFGSFSFYFLFALNFFGKIRSEVVIAVLIIAGLALDVVAHSNFGISILVAGLGLSAFGLVANVVPVEGRVSRYLVIFFVFLLAYVLRYSLDSFLGDKVLPSFTSSVVLSFVINSVVSVLITFVADIASSSIGDSRSFEKIRLR